MKKSIVVIIIPTFNEAEVIEDTLLALAKVQNSLLEFDLHVLVFDSASTDDTVQRVLCLKKTYPWLHLKTEPSKSGLGSAYYQAMQIALTDLLADIVIEFDADLSHQPQYIAPMLEMIKTCDVVVGSRYIHGGSIPDNWGWHRKLLSIIGNQIARVCLTTKYHDFTSGFRATRRKFLQLSLDIPFISRQYAYKIQLLWSLHQAKAKICEYPIAFIDRQKGHSKLPANSILDALKVIWILRYREIKRYIKMCLVGVIGLVVQLVVYHVLRQYLTPFNAAQLSVTAAILNNFYLNSKFTFKQKTHKSLPEKAKILTLFVGYSMLMIQLQSYWLEFGIHYLGAGELKENLIILSGIVLGSLLNYLVYSKLLWNKK